MTTPVWTAEASRGHGGGVAEHSRGWWCQEQASEESSLREADSCTRQLLCKAFTVRGESHFRGPAPNGECKANLV